MAIVNAELRRRCRDSWFRGEDGEEQERRVYEYVVASKCGRPFAEALYIEKARLNAFVASHPTAEEVGSSISSSKPDAIDTSSMTDFFTCGRCKSRKCTYNEVFSRSGDEPAVVHVQCLHCGNRWRMG
jgi:DNA-directed RNA polymerase subunit M/transcription elongation factor TFIIS